MASRLTDKQYRKKAQGMYRRDGEIEIDDDAKVSRNVSAGDNRIQAGGRG